MTPWLPEDCCDDDRAQAGIAPTLAQRARLIEQSMPGEGATERDWRILLGQEGGSLAWPVMCRLMGCLDQATRMAGSPLRCDGI